MLKRLYLRLSGERTYIFDITETVHTEKGDEETWLVRVEPNDLGVCEVVMKSTDCIFDVIENETLVAQRIQPKEWNVLVHACPATVTGSSRARSTGRTTGISSWTTGTDHNHICRLGCATSTSTRRIGPSRFVRRTEVLFFGIVLVRRSER